MRTGLMASRARARLAAVGVAGLLGAGCMAWFASPGIAAPQQDGPQLDPPGERVDRVLMLSLPGLRWTDVATYDLPAIEAFLEEAALADHAPRGVASTAAPGAAYLTISAGARATSDPLVDGQQLAPDDRSAGSPAGEIFQRRTGTAPDGSYVSLAWPSLLRANAAQPFDAEPGLLVDTLADAGLSAAAIGNADGTDTVADSDERQAGLAAASSDGVIPAGDLDSDLLVQDVTRPFGRHLDNDRVVESFQELWRGSRTRPANDGVVLVEASDLARTMRYRDRVDSTRYDELWEEALRDADALVARLLDEIDPGRDAVMLLAPYNLPGDRDLTAAALQTPDGSPGYLRSASTQRSGFVTLVDVGPTILDLLGVERPVAMEGRPFEIVSSNDSLDQRIDRLVSANEASRFREHLLSPTTLLAVVILGLVCAAAIVVIARRGSTRAQHAVALLALFGVALLPMSYLARGFPLEELGLGFYWTFIVGSSLLTAALALGIGVYLGRVRLGLVAVLAVVLAVPAIDAMTGSHLSLSATFGYSPTGNARLYGVSNYALGQISASACLLAGLVASMRSTRGARYAAVALLVVVLAVIGVPIWGANVGGTLSFAPVVALFAGLVLRDRIKLRHLAIGFVGVTVVAITTFALLDLARPPAQRAHLGRFVERLSEEGIAPLLAFAERKGEAAIDASISTFWLAAIPIAVVFFLFLLRYPDGRWDMVRRHNPSLEAGLMAAVGVAILGSIVNDSGAIVAGVALLVVTVGLIYLMLEVQPAGLRRRAAPPTEPERLAGAIDGPASESAESPVDVPAL